MEVRPHSGDATAFCALPDDFFGNPGGNIFTQTRRNPAAQTSISSEANTIELSFPALRRIFTPSIVHAETKLQPAVVTRATDDEALILQLAAGDPRALAAVYDRYAPALYRLLNAILASPADAEDALQEVFVKLATARNPNIQDLRAYLFVTARHQALGMLRRRKRETPLDEAAWENMAGTEGVESDTSNLTALLVRLPVEQREVIALKIWEQMTFAEIAEVVKASPNTVMSRYRYGIERLRSWAAEGAHE